MSSPEPEKATVARSTAGRAAADRIPRVPAEHQRPPRRSAPPAVSRWRRRRRSWRPADRGRPSGVAASRLSTPYCRSNAGGDPEAHHATWTSPPGPGCPADRKSTAWVTPAGLGSTSTREKKTSKPSGMARFSRTASPRRRVRRSSAATWARNALTGPRLPVVIAGGQSQEHVLESLPAGPQVGEGQVALGQPGRQVRHGGGLARGAHPVLTWALLAPPSEREPSAQRHGVDARGARGNGFRPRCPCGVSSAVVPAATTRPRSMITIRSATRSASSSSWVVSDHAHAGRPQFGDHRPGSPAGPADPPRPSARRGTPLPAGPPAPGPATGAAVRRPTADATGCPPLPRQRQPLATERQGPRVGRNTGQRGGSRPPGAIAGYTPPRCSITPTRRVSWRWSRAPLRIEPQHPDGARRGLAVALDGLDGAGLAGAVAPEHGHDFTGGRLQVHAVDRHEPAVAHDEPADVDRGLARHPMGDRTYRGILPGRTDNPPRVACAADQIGR